MLFSIPCFVPFDSPLVEVQSRPHNANSKPRTSPILNTPIMWYMTDKLLGEFNVRGGGGCLIVGEGDYSV